MKTNAEISNLLKASKQLTAFAQYLGMSRQGLYLRLSSNKLKDNLWGVYVQFLTKGIK